MNTKISYLYRDADNYKVVNECVIHGVLSGDQQQGILDCLDAGEYFIPSQVGLPEKRFDDGLTEADHCWFELDKYSFSETEEPPTLPVSADDLVTAFRNKKDRWDDTHMDRMVSVIRCGEKRITEIDVSAIQAGDIFFIDNVASSKFAICAAGGIQTEGPYAWMVCDANRERNWWLCSDLLSDVKPYVITSENNSHAIPSAKRLELNYMTEKVLGLRAARAAAAADGIKFINDIPVIPRGVYIDTEENRGIIHTYLQNRNRMPGFPENMVIYNDGKYISDLAIWGAGVFGELWNPHIKEYIQKEALPEPLQKAHDHLWESSGDDYLVEYGGKYYYMLDHAYTESYVDYFHVQTMSELFDIALENARTAAEQDTLKDCLVLVSKCCRENGNVHYVSVLIDAEVSKEKVDQIKSVLDKCMFKTPEKGTQKSLDEQVQAAARQTPEAQTGIHTPAKEKVTER